MTILTLDFLFTVSSIGSVMSLTALGIWVLPWRDDEMDELEQSVLVLGEWAQRALPVNGQAPTVAVRSIA